MNDEAKKALNDFVITMLDKAEKGADFAGEQIPMVCEEIITWGCITHTMWTALGICCAFVSLVIAFCAASALRRSWDLHVNSDCGAYRKDRNSKESDRHECNGTFLILLAVIFGVTGIVLFSGNVSLAIKAWFAPRLYLVEYLKDLL